MLISHSSIVRKIWSTTDVTLFIFAGASAEFALNREVEWLYYTGKLPADPVGRLFSTIQYAQRIIFDDERGAMRNISNINKIHQHVEMSRGRKISDAAYKDVLYLLIYYSIAAWELLERKLSKTEKDEVVAVFARIGEEMHIDDIPGTYPDWKRSYFTRLRQNLVFSNYTRDLFRRYRRQLGGFRYFILMEIQRILVSPDVSRLLNLGKPLMAHRFVHLYRRVRRFTFKKWLLRAMIPAKFRGQFAAMERVNNKITSVSEDAMLT